MKKDYTIEESENEVYVKTNIKDRDATLNLFNGIYQNNIEKIQEAINNGANLNALRNDNGHNIGVVEYLVKHGPSNNNSWEEKEIEYNKKNGNLIKILNIIQNNGLNLLDNKPLSGFGGNYDNHFAQVIIGRSLKEIEKNPSEWAEGSASNFGDSWIEHAINNNKYDLVKKLIENKNSKNIPWGLIESDNGQTILTMIAYSKDKDLINKILEDVNTENVNLSLNKNKPWSMATEILSQVDNAPSSMIEIMKSITEKLVEKGADLNSVRDEYQNSTGSSIENKKIAAAIMSTIELSEMKPIKHNKLSIK